MTNNVMYSDVAFRPYFDMRKFENSIYNKEIIREKRINTRKKQKVVDNIITFFVVVFSIVAIGLFAVIAYRYTKLATINYQISKLENTIAVEKRKNEGDNRALDKEVRYDDLKMKAYLELNMISPTEKNIIYFDKSDQGFVRQYENIR